MGQNRKTPSQRPRSKPTKLTELLREARQEQDVQANPSPKETVSSRAEPGNDAESDGNRR
jgi:hypothetical protein